MTPKGDRLLVPGPIGATENKGSDEYGDMFNLSGQSRPASHWKVRRRDIPKLLVCCIRPFERARTGAPPKI